jgi:hypothetical protein
MPIMSKNINTPFLFVHWIQIYIFYQHVLRLLKIYHLDHVNFKDFVNKLLGYMGFFTWFANGRHKSNTIEKEDIEKMVKKISNGYIVIVKELEKIYMLTLSINVFRCIQFLVLALRTHVIKCTCQFSSWRCISLMYGNQT